MTKKKLPIPAEPKDIKQRTDGADWTLTISLEERRGPIEWSLACGVAIGDSDSPQATSIPCEGLCGLSVPRPRDFPPSELNMILPQQQPQDHATAAMLFRMARKCTVKREGKE